MVKESPPLWFKIGGYGTIMRASMLLDGVFTYFVSGTLEYLPA